MRMAAVAPPPLAAALSGLLGANNWRNVYSSRTVPMPGADYAISRRFTQVAAKYMHSGRGTVGLKAFSPVVPIREFPTLPPGGAPASQHFCLFSGSSQVQPLVREGGG